MAARRGSAPIQEDATDGLGARRKLTVSRTSDGKKTLSDSELNVVTFDFGFRDPSRQESLLPGNLVTSPPKPWPLEAVSAHANAEVVASFLRDVVKRNNIDNRGGAMRSSVNCWDKSEGVRPARQWKNAFWNGAQMVYGQIRNHDGSFFSIANMQDVVAHEMFHGVTDHTSRLEYRLQSGALNESYSDIFGAIIANYEQPMADWVWRLGEGFDGPGTALRDMSDPTRFGQPKHMRDFQRSTPPYDEYNDYGGVHDNSGIHNFAAYSIISARSAGRYVFNAADVAGLFYLALTVHLSRTSQFSDSRRAVVQSARTLFRN
jgi:Zn-dependent metalloprotease